MTAGVPFIGPEANRLLDWAMMLAALEHGHALPRAELADSVLTRGEDSLLTRSAMIDGLGAAVKTATIFPGNPDRGAPRVNGAVSLFSDTTGELEALVDFHLVTRWKTAADSLLAATRLAPSGVRTILIVGAGTVAESLVFAYRSVWPEAEYLIWNRTFERADALARVHDLTVVEDLPKAVARADIVTVATMTAAPIILGEWLRPGQHVDLIGAFRDDMREADDAALTRSRLFVDSRETTLDHIGELKIPLRRGLIGRGDVIADYYELDRFTRAPEDITLFKNGGGAHLDLMIARAILEAWRLDRR
jgi:ornithine cyclodeaminase